MIVKHPTQPRAWIIVPFGATVLTNVHRKKTCAGQSCVIHNPSEHVMSDFPLHWRSDRGIMERICNHGVGHPDPDDMAWRADRDTQSVHGCDGCCQ